MYTLTKHATAQAHAKGFTSEQVLQAANDAAYTYPSLRVPGQRRHVRAGICAVVDPVMAKVITVYEDKTRTAPRPDQVDADARRYREQFSRENRS